MEEWKDVPGFKGLYEVSNQGRVRSLGNGKTHKTGRILSPGKNRCGYLQVYLSKNGKKQFFQVHRLVWEAFNGPIPNGMEINHLNECVWDNRLENLSLVTRKENINWGTHNRRMAKSKSKMVEQYTLDSEHIMTWFSVNGIQKELGHLGFSESAISKCCKGKLKTHKGFIWKYAE